MDDERILCNFKACAFNDFIDALKPFIYKRPDSPRERTLIYLEGSKGAGTVTGWTCDGYTLAKQTCKSAYVHEDFTGYIAVPRLRASAADIEVHVCKTGSGDMLVSFGDVTFRTRQPKNEVDYGGLYASVNRADEEMLHIGIDRKKLAVAATSLYDRSFSIKGKQPPIVLSVPASPYAAIRLAQGDSERYVLPVRTRLPEKNVLNSKNQGGHAT